MFSSQDCGRKGSMVDTLLNWGSRVSLAPHTRRQKSCSLKTNHAIQHLTCLRANLQLARASKTHVKQCELVQVTFVRIGDILGRARISSPMLGLSTVLRTVPRMRLNSASGFWRAASVVEGWSCSWPVVSASMELITAPGHLAYSHWSLQTLWSTHQSSCPLSRHMKYLLVWL